MKFHPAPRSAIAQARHVGLGLLYVLLAGMSCAPWANAQPASAPSVAPNASSDSAPSIVPPTVTLVQKLPEADAEFLSEAIQRCLANAQSNQLALEKTTNSQVKNLAQQLQIQHARTRDQLVTLALAKGVVVPTTPTLTQKAKLMVLSVREGASFDKAYIGGWGISANEDAVDLFEKAAAEASDHEVRAIAKDGVPALQHAVELARSVQMANPEGKSAN